MPYKINFEAYSNNFSLPKGIIDEDFSSIDELTIKVILLIFANSDKHYSSNLIANLLNVSEDKVVKALEYWVDKNILVKIKQDIIGKQAVVLSKSEKPAISYTIPHNNSELSFLIDCLEERLKRPVTTVEYKSIVHIMEYLKLPADVIIMAVEYCVSIDKVNARYWEKVCTSWADKGITTHELAEQYLTIIKNAKTTENKVKKVFGITNRNLIDSEKEAIAKWTQEYLFDIDVIKLAYERTIMSINKLSFPYINKILASWYGKGYKVIQDILQNENINSKNINSNKTSYDIDELDRYWDTVPKI